MASHGKAVREGRLISAVRRQYSVLTCMSLMHCSIGSLNDQICCIAYVPATVPIPLCQTLPGSLLIMRLLLSHALYLKSKCHLRFQGQARVSELHLLISNTLDLKVSDQPNQQDLHIQQSQSFSGTHSRSI